MEEDDNRLETNLNSDDNSSNLEKAIFLLQDLTGETLRWIITTPLIIAYRAYMGVQDIRNYYKGD